MHLKTLGSEEHNEGQWRVIFHDDFVPEFKLFADAVRREIYARIELLMKFGPQLGRPHVDTLKGSSVPNLKELRFSADDGAWRVAFAFDMKRQAILLVGGDKSGVSQDKFYRKLIEVAERRFDQHQRSLAERKRTE